MESPEIKHRTNYLVNMKGSVNKLNGKTVKVKYLFAPLKTQEKPTYI